jgi:hypothetical protein
MTAGATYVSLASQTLSSAAASVTFSSIPGTYTDLVLIVDGISSSSVNGIVMQYNGNTSNAYSLTQIGSNGSTASSTRRTSQGYININYTGYWTNASRGNIIVQIQNYSNTTTYKTCLARGNFSAIGLDAIVGLWTGSTAAITSVTITNDGSGNIGSGTTFTLYGIAAA